jgi:hypothetical protein
MSAKKQIFQKLKDIRDYDELVKHVGLWHDSMIEPDRLEQFNTPALMVEFPPIQWTYKNISSPKNVPGRSFYLAFNVHVLYKSNKDSVTAFENAEDLRDSILRFLPLWYDTQFSQPILTGETTEHSNNLLHDLTLSLNCNCFESETTGYRTFVKPEETPTLSVEVNGKI